MIAGAYVRKSDADERSADDGQSIERQREHAAAYAATKGWRLDPACVFADDEVSGGEFKKRPGLTRLLGALAPKPAFGALIVMDQSRLGRDTIRTLSLVQAIQDAGVEIRTSGSGSASGGICSRARARGTAAVGRGRGDGTR